MSATCCTTSRLPDTTQGDFWPGIAQIGPVQDDGLPMPLSITKVQLDFVKSFSDKAPAYTLVSGSPGPGQGLMNITDPAGWVCNAPSQLLPLKPGTWRWVLTFTDTAGNPHVYVRGSIAVCKA